MGLYGKYVLPWLLHAGCSQNPIRRQRQKVVPRATGRVLEIGIGTGLNIPFYDPDQVTHLIGVDPDVHVTRRAAEPAAAAPFEVEILNVSAEDIPLEAGSVDCAVITYALCSIPDPARAAAEVRRVLAPGGVLLFSEHGRAPDAAVARWQDRITPAWRIFSGGCHVNRDIEGILREGGFNRLETETIYLPGPRPLNFNTWGAARV